MPTEAPRQHARTGPAEPQLPEPTHAERIRTLLSGLSTGTLSTASRKHPGFPFGSLMPFALDAAGRPLFLISNMAMHTQNLRADPRASLFLSPDRRRRRRPPRQRPRHPRRRSHTHPAGRPSRRPRALPRRSRKQPLLGRLRRLQLLPPHPIDLYYVGGFGVMGWVTAEDYAAAEPDPLAPAAAGILSHMNADHVDSMILLASTHAGLTATAAVMTSVDRLGFTLRLTTADGIKGARINYPAEARNPTAVRQALVAMVQHARA